MTDRRWLVILKEALLRDLGLKLISLVASIGLFYAIHGAEDEQKAVYFDLITRLPDASSGRMLVSDLPVRVRVTLTGTPAQLDSVREEEASVHIDLRDARLRTYEFSPSDFDLPVGVSVTDIDPPSITLEWAQRRERWVRIRPRIAGRPPEGLTVGEEVTVEPQSVLVVGPAEEVASFQFAETTEIDVSSLQAGENQRRVRLARPPAHSYFGEDDYVTVTLSGVPEQAERTIARLDVAAIGGDVRLIRPARVSIVVTGQPAAVQGVDADVVVPYVDASELRAGRGAQLLRVQVRGLPEGVELRRIMPVEVLVTPEG